MSQNMSEVFLKLNDLKNIFQFAEKIVPIIQSLIEFMQEMTPLLETINSSISDSTNQMKKGTDQISDVTNATELATTEILDLVDEIANNILVIESKVKSISETTKAKSQIYSDLTKYIKDDEGILLLNKLKEIENEEIFSELFILLSKINEDSYKITLSLQVQDITAQQLASVNHLIESVQSRLGSLISDIDNTHISEQVNNLKMKIPEGVTFDPNATYTKTEGRQENVDNIIKQQQQEKTSQDEIDKLFS